MQYATLDGMKNGVIAFDIDGTLTHRLDWIDPKVVEMLAGLRERGWEVALFTGRIYSFARQILDFLPFPYILSVQNGADIVQMQEKTHLRRNYLPSSILPILEEAYAGQAEDFIIYAGIDHGDFCYYRPERFSPRMLEYLKVLESLGAAPWQASKFDFNEGDQFPLIKCFGEEGPMRLLNEKLKMTGEVEVSMIRDPIDTTLYLNLVTHPEATKGKAVHYLHETLKPNVVIAAGDDRNDLPMLKEADIAIAIETAPQEILDVADIVAKPAKELGIIDAVEEALNRALG